MTFCQRFFSAMADFFKSEKILKVFSCIILGIPLRETPRKLAQSWFSALLVLFVWYSFGFEMYCTKTYWRSPALKPQIPVEALLLLIPLTLSGSITLTLMVWYFYSNDFHHPHTRLVPHFDFMPEGHQEDIGPTRNDWKYANIFLLFGFLVIILVSAFAFFLNVFFDFNGIHDFTSRIHDWKKILYYIGVSFGYWGFTSAVVACCIFFICCRDIVQHIEFTETLIITRARNYLTARHYHECLLRYTGEVMNTTKLWFVIHSLFFMFIVLTDVISWTNTLSKRKHYDDIIHIVISQVAGSFLVAFKFAFPFLAASRVTARYDKMYQRINRQWRPDDLSEVDPFMYYAIRCEAGFTLFGVRLTAELAFISLLSCLFGIFKLYNKIV